MATRPVAREPAGAGYGYGRRMVNGVAGLTVAAAVRVAARSAEIGPARQTPAERVLSQLEDGLMVTSVALTALTGLQGARLARQAPDGAVPIEDGTTPAPGTPAPAAALQRSIGALGNGSLLAGLGVLSVRAVQDRLAYSRPPARRGLVRLRGA